MNALRKIQIELKAPKNQYNNFGRYKYRSCEDILEAVKPLLDKYNATLMLTDAVEEIGGRMYVKASAIFRSDGDEPITVTAYAREAEEKKGMDASQITGTASSYARKYALNGLFLIDDTKDADTMDNRDEGKPKEYKCADCGKPFEGFTDRNGKFWNVGQVYHMAISTGKKKGITDGKARCSNCLSKMLVTTVGGNQ